MDAVLELDGVTHRYGATVALDTVDLRVMPGECVALLGPNGAGKTTLTSLVTGLLSPRSGRIVVAGGDPARAATRARLGVVQQRVGWPRTLTVAEVVHGAAVRAGASRLHVEPALAEVGLAELRRRRAAKLSGGQQQRLQLAMALVASPTLLVLDEPTTGLDAATRRDFWTTLATRRDRGSGVLLATHQLDEAAAVADRVVVLAHGRVVAVDTPNGLTSRLADRIVSARTCLDVANLTNLPGVLDLDATDGRLRASTTQPERLVRHLLDHDPSLGDLRVEAVGLEHAVLHLTEGAQTPDGTTPVDRARPRPTTEVHA
ncbi:MAG: ABC transporter ATP-binding protein [Nitriliruptoraceae bacterium]|nr:ABC transporter ATP-binding protein [Nitriliruptoraceae bacterium]